MLFYRPLHLARVAAFLNAHAGKVQSFQLGLHGGVTFCHPANAPAKQPELTPAELPSSTAAAAAATSTTAAASATAAAASSAGDAKAASSADDASPVALTFVRAKGTSDWNYPWNLCGNVFRRAEAVDVCQYIELK